MAPLMPAPKTPNTSAATEASVAARRRRVQEKEALITAALLNGDALNLMREIMCNRRDRLTAELADINRWLAQNDTQHR